MALDHKRNIIFTDLHAVNMVNSQGAVVVIAGGTHPGRSDGILKPLFNHPCGLALDRTGNIYVADSKNHRIRKINKDSKVTTITGISGPGHQDGPTKTAQFNTPKGIAIDKKGIIYVADSKNDCIRRIDLATSSVTTIPEANSGYKFKNPRSLVVDNEDNVIVANTGNHNILKISPEGVVSHVAGDGTPGYLDGRPEACKFNTPTSVAIDINGNYIVADKKNNCLRVIHVCSKFIDIVNMVLNDAIGQVGTQC
uniref:SMP-30/Gluconolactonase/LRE-like region domain-containing protein n=1 Tax=Arcella intermedia TaxID=1963864 RepID=A0A6B2LEW4_9EUKA